MLTAAQQHAVEPFAKSPLALADDALIDTYQAWEDHREASVEGSDTPELAPVERLAEERRATTR